MIYKQERMSFNRDCSSALHLLEHIQQTINNSNDAQLQMQTAEDINMLISVFSNPILRSIVSVEDSLAELNQQLQQHPSILPVDLYVTPSGELSINVVPPDEIYDSHYDSKFIPHQELDDQRVPVAKLSNSSSTDTSASPQQLGTPGVASETLPPITTQTYAIEFQKAIEESSRGREIVNVQLYKPEGSSLGFSVVGLRSEEKGELGIFVQDIQNSGIAGRDGNLREGDQILAIDGQPLDSNISHQQAISILQKARGLVELVVARGGEEETPQTPSPIARSPSAVSDTSKAGSDMVLNTEWSQVEVIDLVNDGSGLGFGIIGGRSTGVVVKTILPGGVADRDGRLQSGDHILQIGDVNLRGMGSEQVAAVLRQSGSHVRLVVARPVEPTSPDYQALGSQAPIVPTKILGDPEELDRHLLQNGYTEALSRQTPILDTYNDHFIFREHQQDIESRSPASISVEPARNSVGSSIPLLATPSLSVLTMDMLPQNLETSALPEMEKFSVELKKDLHGLGITIAGYVCEKEELSGIFVKSISEGSAADLCKSIQVNDRIVEVDGRSLQGYTNHQAVEVLRSTGQTVKLCLERYLRGPKFEQLQQAIAASELKLPVLTFPSASSLPRFSERESVELEQEIEPHPEIDSVGLESIDTVNLNVDIQDLEMLIDDDYEGALKPTVEAAIQAKWNKIIGNDSEIIVAQLCKLSEGGGLGISLEGTVDVEHGQEVRPHHYIRSILPEGPVGRNGRLRSGDELLEVNGHRLLGMNHIEVVSILKDLPMSVRMVCSRRHDNTLPHRLIDTSQDKVAFAARNILGGSLQNLIPTTDRLVKAKSDGSLASTTTATAIDGSFSKMKSRSLEPLTGLAMWSSEPQIIELVKGERGLGFSILDYQDPMNPNETVIVIRSLVPGGVAQMDGQLIPGDRLVFVNDTNLENASLDQAVQALKGSPKGIVRIGVAKPLPIPDSVSHCQECFEDISKLSPTIDDQSMFSSCESLLPSQEEEELKEDNKFSGHKEKERKKEKKKSEKDSDEGLLGEELLERRFSTDGELEKSTDDDLSADLLQLMVPVAKERGSRQRTFSLGDTTDDDLDEEDFQTTWAADVIHLPPSIEVEIRVHKGNEPLGISVDSTDQGVNGMLVVMVVPGGAIARDGHIHPGDYLISVNHETLRKVTNAQARAILRRAQLLSADVSVTYIPGEAATAYRKSIKQESQFSQSPLRSSPLSAIRRTSPRSPYIPSDSSVESSDEREKDIPKKEKVASVLPSAVSELIKKPSEDDPELNLESQISLHPDQEFREPLNSTVKVSKDVVEPCLPQTVVSERECSCITELQSETNVKETNASSAQKVFQTQSLDSRTKSGPLSVCVVDGLYSVHSPKGNKVLVGIELSRKSDISPKVKEKKLVPTSLNKIKNLKAASSEESVDLECSVKEKEPVPCLRESKSKKLTSQDNSIRQIIEEPKSTSLSLISSAEEKNLQMATESETSLVSCSYIKPHTDVSCSGEINKNIEINVDILEIPDRSAIIECTSEKYIKEKDNTVQELPAKSVIIDVEERNVTEEPESDAEIGFLQSSNEVEKSDNKRKLSSTRVSSFECTCDRVLEDKSLEQICTCISPSELPETSINVCSDDSKRTSRFYSAEITAQSDLSSRQELSHYQEIVNTESIISSGEEFKSGATSPFYSPRGDSPETAATKHSSKIDKEVTANILLAKHWGPERLVEVVKKPNSSLGISIVGGKVDLFNAGPDSSSAILGIFIKNVLPNSPAGQNGELKTGDRILEVDSIDLRSASHERAVEVIRGAGNRVRFLVQSLIQWNVGGYSEATAPSASLSSDEKDIETDDTRPSPNVVISTPERVLIKESLGDLQKQLLEETEQSTENIDTINEKSDQVIKESETLLVSVSESAATVQSDSVKVEKKEDSEEDEDSEDYDEFRDLQGKIRTSKGVEISRSSAGNVKRSLEEIISDPEEEDEFGYTLNKVKKKYGNLGDSVLVVHLEKTHKGLGISLAGHKDRNRMAVFVCGINPNGTAYKTGGIQVGDEILEVNGVVLQGRCHLNASAIIKGLPGPTFKIIILRRASALEELAVKPITQFPVSLDDEPSEQKYAKFKGTKTVTIKKGNQNLGIMIIEGKHAEVGQGIFISDIQEGSAAEQAGLVIGDMILAVNKDTLLGANYDTAANLLKKTEGVVTLIVCNPNKAKEEEKELTEAKGTTPSRSPTPVQKEPEKSRLISFSGLKPLKPSSPSKSLFEYGGSVNSNETQMFNSTITASTPLLPTTTQTPKTSPVLPLRKCSSGKLAEELPPDPTTCPIVPGKEVLIEILKDKMPLGLSIIGGSDTLLGAVVVHEVYPQSAASKDGRLRPGDQILEVNFEDFGKVTHAKALTILRQTQAKVKMLVYRDESITKENLLQIIEMELFKKPGKGLGLSVAAKKDGSQVFISEIVHGGVAEADGRLMKGDYILEVNGVSLENTSQETVAIILKACTGKVLLKIGRIKCKKFSNTSNGKLESIQEPRTVILEKRANGLGFSIVGGRDSAHGDLPIYVKTVFEKNSATEKADLKPGDRILTVDGVSLEGLTHEEAVAVLKSSQGFVRLTVA